MKRSTKGELPLDMIGKVAIALLGIAIGVSVLVNHLGGLEPDHQARKIIETAEHPVCPGYEGTDVNMDEFQVLVYGFHRNNCEESIEFETGFSLSKNELEDFLEEMDITDSEGNPLVLYDLECNGEEIFEGIAVDTDDNPVFTGGTEVEIEKEGGTIYLCQD